MASDRPHIVPQETGIRPTAQTGWRVLGHDVGLDELAPVGPAIHDGLHLHGVPSHDGISQQAQTIDHAFISSGCLACAGLIRPV
jgi:hypothetical protein